MVERNPNVERRHTERRHNLLEIKDIVTVKLADLEIRRDRNLQQKIDALEKLINLTFLTKSEALGIAVTRMQGDSKDCISRCTTQVEKFYSLIHKINSDNVGRDIHIKTLLDAIHEINKSVAELEKYHDTDIENIKDMVNSLSATIESKVDELEKYHDASVEKEEAKNKACAQTLEAEIAELKTWKGEIETWKGNFWIKNVSAAVIVSIFISQVLFQGFTWVIDFLSKVPHGLP